MILDDLSGATRYHGVHPGLAAGFAALRSAELASLPVGRHPLDGDRLFLIIGRDPGRLHSGARLEAHRKYIDIQLTISGDEEIGWRPLAECAQVTDPYNAERDITFFADASTSWIALPPRKFMVLFPEDAHAPLAGKGELHKAVVKVAVDWQ